MRIWDISPSFLCSKHLLGEHSELHAIWNIITDNKTGYSRHPETIRWRGKLAALYRRHEMLVSEMTARGFRHNSPLDKRRAKGRKTQNLLLASPDEQKEILKKKNCGCFKKR